MNLAWLGLKVKVIGKGQGYGWVVTDGRKSAFRIVSAVWRPTGTVTWRTFSKDNIVLASGPLAHDTKQDVIHKTGST